MRKVTAVGEIQTHKCISRLETSHKHRHICLRTRVRLHICILCIKELAYSVYCKLLNLVHHFTTAIIPCSGITLRIFVGAYGAERLQHLITYKILRSYKLYAIHLTIFLFLKKFSNFQILFHISCNIIRKSDYPTLHVRIIYKYSQSIQIKSIFSYICINEE